MPLYLHLYPSVHFFLFFFLILLSPHLPYNLPHPAHLRYVGISWFSWVNISTGGSRRPWNALSVMRSSKPLWNNAPPALWDDRDKRRCDSQTTEWHEGQTKKENKNIKKILFSEEAPLKIKVCLQQKLFVVAVVIVVALSCQFSKFPHASLHNFFFYLTPQPKPTNQKKKNQI